MMITKDMKKNIPMAIGLSVKKSKLNIKHYNFCPTTISGSLLVVCLHSSPFFMFKS